MLDALPDRDQPRPFNTPLECGFRLLFILSATYPARSDLQRLISYDYLLVHSGDVDGGPESLHPSVPFRGGEWLVRREVISLGLDLMFSRELASKDFGKEGITYGGTQLTAPFIGLLNDAYATELNARAAWLASRFGNYSDKELLEFMRTNIGRWGAEFERLSAIKDLEL